MPRQVRVEYEDAIYHVMARGNRLNKIVRTDADREAFEATLVEVPFGTVPLYRKLPEYVNQSSPMKKSPMKPLSKLPNLLSKSTTRFPLSYWIKTCWKSHLRTFSLPRDWG